ncbi:L-lysine 2-3-aminomutase [Penicillium canariense]|uniref:L-lysine 2-3-aminomutase n=1 Tax=Penicillium canariense TaxID=189055 RepID=A0A9W9HPZ7_9EURO|nr:L-lysine 2-3-aminomutase [Penicillium canariense]KAJ5152745.1 L-lysine 2-3-aminomutase [Penicillium canariense]
MPSPRFGRVASAVGRNTRNPGELTSYFYIKNANIVTYDHRVWRTGLPVRSAVLKPHAGQLVVWWVTTCESWLLYVFLSLFFGIQAGNFKGFLLSIRTNLHSFDLMEPRAEERHDSTM